MGLREKEKIPPTTSSVFRDVETDEEAEQLLGEVREFVTENPTTTVQVFRLLWANEPPTSLLEDAPVGG